MCHPQKILGKLLLEQTVTWVYYRRVSVRSLIRRWPVGVTETNSYGMSWICLQEKAWWIHTDWSVVLIQIPTLEMLQMSGCLTHSHWHSAYTTHSSHDMWWDLKNTPYQYLNYACVYLCVCVVVCSLDSVWINGHIYCTAANTEIVRLVFSVQQQHFEDKQLITACKHTFSGFICQGFDISDLKIVKKKQKKKLCPEERSGTELSATML